MNFKIKELDKEISDKLKRIGIEVEYNCCTVQQLSVITGRHVSVINLYCKKYIDRDGSIVSKLDKVFPFSFSGNRGPAMIAINEKVLRLLKID
jgi:hypothetical protein